MIQLLKVTLLTLLLPLFLNAQETYTCPYGEHFEQGTAHCITGVPAPAPEPLVTCPSGESMQQQGVPGSCANDTPIIAPPGLFLSNPCGASQRQLQGSIDPESCVDMPNTPPVAYAGGNKVITEGISPILLYGGSRDMDEDDVTYQWVFIQRPAGSNTILDNSTSANASFEPDVPGIYVVQLIVYDGENYSEPDLITIKINQVPIAAFTGPIVNLWGQDFDLNANASFDPDGTVVTYNWTPNYSTSVINSIPAPELGNHEYSLSVTDDDGATSPGVKRNIETIMCAGQEDIDLTDDVEGTVNIDQVRNNTESCYKVYLTSNNDTEQYAFYMNLFEGTDDVSSYNVEVTVYDQDGTVIKTFSTGLMDEANVHMKEQFEITQNGTYYIKINRYQYAANYIFSIHPSLENGLVQDEYEGEINDFMNMATPLVLDGVNTLSDVSGTLNTTRQQDTSIKNTDDTDWYSLDINNPGVYAFYMNLFEGTADVSTFNVEVTVYNEDGTQIKTFSTGLMDETNVHIKEQFEITQNGTYYIKINRYQYAANYIFSIHPSLENGLVQDEYEGEINDFMNMATPLVLDEANTLSDVSGTLNTIRQQDTSIKNTDDTDWYSLDINNPGVYAFYMNLFEGTADVSTFNVEVTVYNEDGTQIKTFSTGLMDETNVHIKEQFEITQNGTYYIKINRYQYAANYIFSIHPSLENGLVQDEYEGEINDFMNMATPLSINADDSLDPVNGNINVTRQEDTSMKKTDDTDWYSLDIKTTGTYALNMTLLAGTADVSTFNVEVKIHDENNVLIKEFSTGYFDEEGAPPINETFNIRAEGTYFISIYRYLYTAEYSFFIDPSI